MAMSGELPLQVRCGMPVSDVMVDVHGWWSIFSAWGSSARRGAVAIPTAWRLSPAQADVVMWSLCGVAVRLALAASAPSVLARSMRPFDWSAHVVARSPEWLAGAGSVWSLMQRGRAPKDRTVMPEGLLPSLSDASSWPWRSESSGMLGGVPDSVEEGTWATPLST
jgi:hypothetical protein